MADLSSLDGHKHQASRHHRTGGGVAANAAVAVARLGGRATLLTCVGDDADGDEVLAGLERDGVDIRRARRVPGASTSISAVIVAAGGERTIVNHMSAGLLSGTTPDARGLEFDAVVVDGRWPAGTEMALRLARERDVPAIVDVDRHISDDEQRGVVFSLATHVVFGSDALNALTGSDDPTEGLIRAAELTTAHVAVTCGSSGVWYLEDGDLCSVPAFDIAAVDTTAAGDVFHGAFALALAEGADALTAHRFASAAAAVKCTRPGGRDGIPDRTEVNVLLGLPPSWQAPCAGPVAGDG